MVKFYRTLDGGVADHVAMGQVIGQNTNLRFLLMVAFVCIAIKAAGMGSTIVGLTVSGGHDNLRGVKLRVVQELGCLGRRLLLKGYCSILGSVVGWGNLDVGNLAAIGADGLANERDDARMVLRSPEAKELSDLLLFSLSRDLFDVDGRVGSHGRICKLSRRRWEL